MSTSKLSRSAVSDGITRGQLQVAEIPKLLLTPREAAAALCISERSLWSLTRSGTVPAVRIGRSVRYDPVALQAWIASHQTV
jgi:excisionase family DNA binding protein